MNTPVLWVVGILDGIILIVLALIVIFGKDADGNITPQSVTIAMQLLALAGPTTAALLAFGQSRENKKEVMVVKQDVKTVDEKVENVSAKSDQMAKDMDGHVTKLLAATEAKATAEGKLEGVQMEREHAAVVVAVASPAITPASAEAIGDKIVTAIEKNTSETKKDVKVVKQDVKDVKRLMEEPEEKP